MRVQSVDLGFGKRPKKNECEQKPNIFFATTLGATFGAISGSLARKYTPVSDSFFSNVAQDDSDKKNEVEKTVNEYIDSYGNSEIEEARVLKTALADSELQAQSTGIKGKGIVDLMKDQSIKLISDDDTDEVKNSYKALRAQIKEEVADLKEPELIQNKYENLSGLSSETLQRAKQAIFVKDNLQKYKSQIKGISDKGEEGLKSVTQKVKNHPEGTEQMKSQLNYAFSKMVVAAKKSQRAPETWVLIPAVIGAVLSMGLAVNAKAKKQFFNESKTEPKASNAK
jgi:hypothetical protein